MNKISVIVIALLAAAAGFLGAWFFTGAGNARNSFNVLSSSLCVAIGGGAGTLSEIALALKNGIPTWTS